MGKGFAYFGVPPLFIGEVLVVLGMFVFLMSGCWVVLATPPLMLLLALMAITVMGTLRYIGTYGVDAPRDAVIVMYGLFSIVVAALLLERPGRLDKVLLYFQKFAFIYIALFVPIFIGSMIVRDQLPGINATPFVNVRAGEMGFHLGGIASLAILGLLRVNRWFLSGLILAMLLVVAQSRGGALAYIVPIAAAAALSGRLYKMVVGVGLAAVLLTVLSVADLEFDMSVFSSSPQMARTIGTDQITKNVTSIFGQSDGSLEGTKQFRLNWWTAIVDYTVFGPYFWTGKGFGVNLAIDDGYVVGEEFGGPPLRSPHNGHLTVLARTGVPGLVLWIALFAAWCGRILLDSFSARHRGLLLWSNFFLFLFCYALAGLVDAAFDVALEGPMVGIPFWIIIGIGVGASMIYRFDDRMAFNDRAHSVRIPKSEF